MSVKKRFVITTESNSDLPAAYLKENEIGIIPHYYDMDGITYGEDKLLTDKEFYDRMRKGVMPTTMASNPEVIRETFISYAKQGLDILHISFSSELSGGYSNVAVGAKEVCEEYPDIKIIVIDTLNASLGEGMVIMKAVELRAQGRSIEQTADWLNNNKLHFCVQFTVDDLFHLHRGGRVSKTTAIVGSMINVKPILYINNQGALVALMNVRGRKKSLITLVDNMLAGMGQYYSKDATVCIVHGDVPGDAQFVADLVREKLPDANIVVNTIGPSIGAHSGPGALGICYMGDHR
ncbi:MAG: DegV family protein [Lachnospiraceae bacterium]|nr:DegV family protein [Lachnospiraceae bacterium]